MLNEKTLPVNVFKNGGQQAMQQAIAQAKKYSSGKISELITFASFNPTRVHEFVQFLLSPSQLKDEQMRTELAKPEARTRLVSALFDEITVSKEDSDAVGAALLKLAGPRENREGRIVALGKLAENCDSEEVFSGLSRLMQAELEMHEQDLGITQATRLAYTEVKTRRLAAHITQILFDDEAIRNYAKELVDEGNINGALLLLDDKALQDYAKKLVDEGNTEDMLLIYKILNEEGPTSLTHQAATQIKGEMEAYRKEKAEGATGRQAPVPIIVAKKAVQAPTPLPVIAPAPEAKPEAEGKTALSELNEVLHDYVGSGESAISIAEKVIDKLMPKFGQEVVDVLFEIASGAFENAYKPAAVAVLQLVSLLPKPSGIKVPQLAPEPESVQSHVPDALRQSAEAKAPAAYDAHRAAATVAQTMKPSSTSKVRATSPTGAAAGQEAAKPQVAGASATRPWTVKDIMLKFAAEPQKQDIIVKWFSDSASRDPTLIPALVKLVSLEEKDGAATLIHEENVVVAALDFIAKAGGSPGSRTALGEAAFPEVAKLASDKYMDFLPPSVQDKAINALGSIASSDEINAGFGKT